MPDVLTFPVDGHIHLAGSCIPHSFLLACCLPRMEELFQEYESIASSGAHLMRHKRRRRRGDLYHTLRRVMAAAATFGRRAEHLSYKRKIHGFSWTSALQVAEPATPAPQRQRPRPNTKEKDGKQQEPIHKTWIPSGRTVTQCTSRFSLIFHLLQSASICFTLLQMFFSN